MLSKFMDKAKPKFTLHHHNKSGSTSSSAENHGLLNSLTNTLQNNHIFGYKDDKKDSYVEPLPSKLYLIFLRL